MIAWAMLRILGSASALVALYYALPLNHSSAWATATMLVIGLVVFVGLVAFQVGAILRSPFPGLRAIEAVTTSVPLVTVSVLWVLSRLNPDLSLTTSPGGRLTLASNFLDPQVCDEP